MKRKIQLAVFALFLIILFFNILVYKINVQANSYSEKLLEQSVIQTEINELFGSIEISSCDYLYNLDESGDFIYVEFVDSGYVILSALTLDVLEYSYGSRPPFVCDERKYYAGPTHYLVKENDEFRNIGTNEVLTSDEKKEMIKISKNLIGYSNNQEEIKVVLNKENNNRYISEKNKNLSLLSSCGDQYIIGDGLGPGATYIDNVEYFTIGPYHGNNTTGTCSAVASQLLLSYNNYYNDRRIIDNSYLFYGENNPNTCTNPMDMTCYTLGTQGDAEIDNYQYNYFAKVVNEIPRSSSYITIKNGLENLLAERKNILNLTDDLAIVTRGTDLNEIKNEIDANRPIIISMHSNEYTNHAVIGYGYQLLVGSGTNQDNQFGYIVHFGWGKKDNWKNMSNVWINSGWCFNWVKMVVPHIHSYGAPAGSYYVTNCICGHRISNFPFLTTTNGNEVTIVGVDDELPNSFAIPSRINGKMVVSIESNAFCDCEEICNIEIPNSIQTIGFGAFSGCKNLESMTIPFVGHSRTSLGSQSSFGYIFGSSYYPNSLITVQNNTSYYLPISLTTIKIKDTMYIQSHAFENCNKIETISLPS